MAFRLRRALSLPYPLLHCSIRQPKPISSHLLSTSISITTPAAAVIRSSTQPFTSTSTLFVKAFEPDNDKTGSDFHIEGDDSNHWLVAVDFPDFSGISREQMIQTYVDIAAKVFGSVEEAKKKIYALSTTEYEGFHVECSKETSNKFKSIPGVMFVSRDSKIEPTDKVYRGDKYMNGEIITRHYEGSFRGTHYINPIRLLLCYHKNKKYRGTPMEVKLSDLPIR